MSETKLEIRFDKLDREKLGRHRGSRWNKYKAGITTPGRELLTEVDSHIPGTLKVFDHPVWELAAGTQLTNQQLRELVFRLPTEFADLFCKKNATVKSDFWVNEEFHPGPMIQEILQSYANNHMDRLTTIAALLVLVHDGHLRQREAQHHSAHLAIVRVERSWEPKDKFSAFLDWRLESLVLQEWLKTEYTDVKRRDLLDELRAIKTGQVEPWIPQQSSLKLASSSSKKETADRQSTKGYWVAQRLLNPPKSPWPYKTNHFSIGG